MINALKRVGPDLAIGLLAGVNGAAFAATLSALGCTHGFALALILVAAEAISILTGAVAGVAALGGGALCLTLFLFEPLSSIHITSGPERLGLIWMLALGAPLCVALSWASSRVSRKRTRTVEN